MATKLGTMVEPAPASPVVVVVLVVVVPVVPVVSKAPQRLVTQTFWVTVVDRWMSIESQPPLENVPKPTAGPLQNGTSVGANHRLMVAVSPNQ